MRANLPQVEQRGHESCCVLSFSSSQQGVDRKGKVFIGIPLSLLGKQWFHCINATGCQGNFTQQLLALWVCTLYVSVYRRGVGVWSPVHRLSINKGKKKMCSWKKQHFIIPILYNSLKSFSFITFLVERETSEYFKLLPNNPSEDCLGVLAKPHLRCIYILCPSKFPLQFRLCQVFFPLPAENCCVVLLDTVKLNTTPESTALQCWTLQSL